MREVPKFQPNPKNPFATQSRIYAYFEEFLQGQGAAMCGDLVKSCLALTEEMGGTDHEVMIRTDLNNQVRMWLQGKWGLMVQACDWLVRKDESGCPLRGERDKRILRVVVVRGIPWDAFIAKTE